MSPSGGSGPSTGSPQTFPSPPDGSWTLSASCPLPRGLVRALGPIGHQIPCPLLLKPEAAGLSHASRTLGVAEQRQDGAGYRVRVPCNDEAVDPVAHHLTERRDVAGGDRPPPEPGFEGRGPQRPLRRGEGEDGRPRVNPPPVPPAHHPPGEPPPVLPA